MWLSLTTAELCELRSESAYMLKSLPTVYRHRKWGLWEQLPPQHAKGEALPPHFTRLSGLYYICVTTFSTCSMDLAIGWGKASFKSTIPWCTWSVIRCLCLALSFLAANLRKLDTQHYLAPRKWSIFLCTPLQFVSYWHKLVLSHFDSIPLFLH